MTLKKAMKSLESEYERAKKMEWVHDPVAYALYQVWKAADTDRNGEKGGEKKRTKFYIAFAVIVSA